MRFHHALSASGETLLCEHYSFDHWGNTLLDEKTSWVAGLAREIQGVQGIEKAAAPQLAIELSIKRQADDFRGNFLLLKALVKGRYQTACVRCLEEMWQEFEQNFQAAFLASHFEDTPECRDLSGLSIDGEEYELYFDRKGKVDLREFLHEQMQMNANPFPLHHPDCRGLCPECGQNLNHGDCRHVSFTA